MTVNMNERVILPSLGDSKNLSLEEREIWDRWGVQVVKLARSDGERVLVNGNPKEKTVCLTFDDGPDAENMPKMLDILNEFGIKGSFFCLGSRAEKLPEIVKRAFDEGHIIGNHTYTHPELTLLGENEIGKEIISAEDIIDGIIGRKTALVRPPYGIVDERVVQIIFRLGYKISLWSLNTFDWLEKTKNNIIKNVVDNIRPGDIVLMHSFENKEPTVEALPVIINGLHAKGYKFVDLAQMLGIEPYKD